MRISIHIERWSAARPFRIAGRTWDTFDSTVVEVAADGAVGRGEATGAFYLGESAESIAAALEAVRPSLESGLARHELASLLPPSGSRNAVDCALWDLEAKRTGRRVWEIAAVAVKDLQTTLTIGLEASIDEVVRQADAARSFRALKIKLDADDPLARVTAVHRRCPNTRLFVDANQSWSMDQLATLAPQFARLGVEMIEQPLPRGADAELVGFRSPVPLCADESCLHLGDLDHATRHYQAVNIKLDKAGGLTDALALARAAHGRGLRIMVGCMGGTSLAMAPAFVVGCLGDVVDLDGPLLMKRDRLPGLEYRGDVIPVYPSQVWG